jgi:hypothetical protein
VSKAAMQASARLGKWGGTLFQAKYFNYFVSLINILLLRLPATSMIVLPCLLSIDLE